MTFLRKNSLEIFTLIVLAVVSAASVFTDGFSDVKRLIIAFILLFTLHEWEENRFPGGFSKLMMAFTGQQFEKEREEWSHIPVYILLIVILLPALFFELPIFLVLIPVILAFFECFVHIAGIFLHKTGKPYTPGLITALLLCLVALLAATVILKDKADGRDYALGAVCMLVLFGIMQRTVLAINGFGYKDMLAAVKKKFSK